MLAPDGGICRIKVRWTGPCVRGRSISHDSMCGVSRTGTCASLTMDAKGSARDKLKVHCYSQSLTAAESHSVPHSSAQPSLTTVCKVILRCCK
jgi:hypothetical protein